MNVHPIFVHFPIALLSFYAILEVLQFRILTAAAWYRPIKLFLLYAGTVMAGLAWLTGETAKHLVGRTPLIAMHSNFAITSFYIFALLSLVYVIDWLAHLSNAHKVLVDINKYTSWLSRAPWNIILAVLGFVAITITGALGGAIVYGPDFDPAMSFIYHLFF